MNLLTEIIEIHLAEKLELHKCSVISLGCGIGVTECGFKCSKLDGMDIFSYGNRHLLNNWDNIRGTFISGDIRKSDELIKNKSYDIVFCLDVIEHLEKEEGFKLIKDAESIAIKAVVFYTPLKWDTNESATTDKSLWSYGNKYNLHKSLWTIKEFEDKGYKVYLEYPSSTNPVGLIAIKYM